MTRDAGPTLIAALGLGAVTGYATWAAVQILVLNPLAAVPGRTLAQIREDAEAAGQSLAVGQALPWLGIGVVLAIAVVVVVRTHRAITSTQTVIAVLSLLVLGAPGYFVASFSWGMNLADTYGISGADYSPWARPLYAVSLAALACLVAIGVRAVLSRRADSLAG